mmetsp:Transcript_28596/g.54656  ORF Transcript_28596/g.54656 Transcript_28596/m.54656 type:complete len:486 (+) Transcript_28596:446-1903(+)|eukprot:CAMPEP_0114270654 /NCGR_PEP_ID=MMETSP0058-20121206/27369_1 /TAXON_ID=36894 /ORGANISM="Pyramimonas parkeae, CCMP726" /LENGTH=485 /DNA_ID=CAMNT_0001389437 /DNA_START=414 /DNA_END=1871 /DNA_ORIENTATION=+
MDALDEALENGIAVGHVDISGLKLERLPSQLISENRLSASAPGNPPDFPPLVSLNLSSNSFACTPAGIHHLISLTTLSFAWNKLEDLGSEVGELVSLTHLDVSYNSLQTLPPSIGRLSRLTTLYVNDNQLSALPSQMGLLENLTTFRMQYNQVRELPHAIGHLDKLSELDVTGNPLVVPPADVVYQGVRATLHHLRALASSSLPESQPEPVYVDAEWSDLPSSFQRRSDSANGLRPSTALVGLGTSSRPSTSQVGDRVVVNIGPYRLSAHDEADASSMLASMPAITFPFAAAASRLSRRKERDADSTNHRSHATTPSVANAALYENICLPPRPRSAGFTFGPSRNSVWDSCSSTNGVFGALASSSSRDSGSGIERPRTGMSQNLASLASLPEDDLDCVQALLRARNPTLAVSLQLLLDDDVDEEMACREQAHQVDHHGPKSPSVLPGAGSEIATTILRARPSHEVVNARVQSLSFLDDSVNEPSE